MRPMRKWWLGSVEERAAHEDELRLLAEINARAAVPVEVVDGVVVPEPPAAEPGSPPIRERFLKEAHHRQYGRPWGMGHYLFEFVRDAGLRPEHRLLDFGCGALRLGILAIPYLDAGNYFGVDSHLVSLEAAATYEVPVHRLEEKQPRLLWNDDFALTHFGMTFDYVVDVSSSSRVKEPERLRRVFASFAEVLKPGGMLLTVPKPKVATDELAGLGLELVRGEVIQPCPLFEGHEESFRPYNVWNEFRRV
jgi:SAM-dependent methyltransferase